MNDEPLVLPLDEHNRKLLASVRPEGWRNPTPFPRYHLVVIGAGPAGLVAAVGAAGLGARVALVERALLGGDCLNVGCVPSKALVRSGRAVHDAKGVAAYGARLAGEVEPDFTAAMARLRRLRAGLAPADSAERLAGLGIHVFLGEGRFAGDDAVEVAGTRLAFRRALIATGARNFIPPVPGLAEIRPLTNENVFWLTERPRRLVLIGAGPIGCEIGQALRRLGCDVTFVSLDPRVLPREDPDAAAIVQRALEREGIVLHLGARVLAAEARGAERAVIFEVDGQRREVVADQVFVSIGRSANVEGLGLERAGVEWDKQGVKVDDRLRTTNPRVFAAGDVCSPYKFTHAADAMARLVIGNALFPGRGKASRLVIPWATYTDPEVAHVGLYEAEAKEKGLALDTLTWPFHDLDRAVLEGDTEGFARVHLAAGTDRILGATVVSRHASELIAEVTLAMTRGLGLRALSSTVHAYPTASSVWQRLADLRNRERLTPRIRAWLGAYFAWTA